MEHFLAICENDMFNFIIEPYAMTHKPIYDALVHVKNVFPNIKLRINPKCNCNFLDYIYTYKFYTNYNFGISIYHCKGDIKLDIVLNDKVELNYSGDSNGDRFQKIHEMSMHDFKNLSIKKVISQELIHDFLKNTNASEISNYFSNLGETITCLIKSNEEATQIIESLDKKIADLRSENAELNQIIYNLMQKSK